MLMKLLFCDAHNYERSLKRRRLAAFGLLAVGLIGITCYFLLVDGGPLPDFAQGFYLGAASGACLGAVILLVRTQVLLSDPEKRKQAKIKETDERERQIVHSAFEWAGFVTFFAAVAALFVTLPVNIAAFRALMGIIVLYALLFLLFSVWLERKL